MPPRLDRASIMCMQPVTVLKRQHSAGNASATADPLHRSAKHAANADTGTISTVLLADALATVEVKTAIETISGENYQNAPVLLEQEYQKNNQIFLYREEEAIRGFFMVGWSVVRCAEDDQTCVFLGLSSVSPDYKGKGIGGRLYRAFMEDGRAWELAQGRQLVWWFHTASSVVARSFWKIASEIAPQPDGRCDDELLWILRCISQAYGMDAYASGSVPFLLRGYAKARYASSEVERLDALRAGAGEDLLSRLGVNERNGDRLLFVGRIPPAPVR
jgi:GNAT superfamily N-acetyltransferase